MISYRSLKKLIGETSLERKCRFLFGLALLVLITSSFYLYAARTRLLVEHQQVNAARGLADRFVLESHYQKFISQLQPDNTASIAGANVGETPGPEPSDAGNVNSESGDAAAATAETQVPEPVARLLSQVSQFQEAMNRSRDLSSVAKWRLIDVNDDPGIDSFYEALRRFRESGSEESEYSLIREIDGNRQLEYYKAIRIRPGGECISCHQNDYQRLMKEEADRLKETSGGTFGSNAAAASDNETASAPLFAVARVELSMKTVEAQLSRNRAVLLASGIVTSFLAMMASYVIVRYIIVKPVLHLKDVSDEIARGNLNLRADINTGDEFEELGQAFNRMLRHMMTVNDELRGLNLNLDIKVDQLARLNMELFNNGRLKDDFLATMSHELRTPLNSILGFSDILQSAPNLDERQKRYVHNIQTSGQSLMVQINDLLDLAKIESGKMELHPDDVSVSDIIEQQVQQIAPLADRKNIDLRIDPAPSPLPPIFQDRGKISQILNNLLSNAIKFTPEGGRVRVGSRQAGATTIEISVEDTGIGIPLHEQEHIFEKFRQGSTAPEGRDHVTREYEGTGLGLSIVRELSRLLGGDVSVQSEFGKGSLFIVRLPVRVPTSLPEPSVVLESRTLTGLGRITSVDLMNSVKKTAAVDVSAEESSGQGNPAKRDHSGNGHSPDVD
ncbi:MAG: ATP-binding protein [Planctomyces sp.]